MSESRDPRRRIESKDNATFKAWKKIAQGSTEYKKTGQVWLDGDHLCSAYVARGKKPSKVIISEHYWPYVQHRRSLFAIDFESDCWVLPQALFAELSSLGSAGNIGFLIELPSQVAPQPGLPTVVLDRVQDAGNVGSILRSAAAFGFSQVLAVQGTAGLWSPKVLRAAMGAHFGLRLVEGLPPPVDPTVSVVAEAPADWLSHLGVPLIATSSHRGAVLHTGRLPYPCVWAMGHEGQGISAAMLARASLTVSIAQPGGEESLNVAAAAAICLHHSASAAGSGLPA